MSEDQATELDDRPHSAATDPHSTVAAGDRPDNWHPSGPGSGVASMSDAEREHNANMFGVTYRERYGGRGHKRCIVLCVAPNPKRLNQCPSCYGKAVPIDIYAAQLQPAPGWGARLGRWMGEWFAAFWEAMTLPFHRSEEHARALVMNVLQDMTEKLIAELTVVQICPKCQAETKEGE